jgi:glycosyltransferase involved in cell wall biosynthesis
MRFAAGDVSALEIALRRMIDEPALIEKWGEASRAKAASWSPEAGAEKWIAAFRACGVLASTDKETHANPHPAATSSP